MKIIASVVALVFALAGVAVIAAGPLMLVLGALHGSDGLAAVPALGFFQTLGGLFVVSTVGGAFRGGFFSFIKGTTDKSSK